MDTLEFTHQSVHIKGHDEFNELHTFLREEKGLSAHCDPSFEPTRECDDMFINIHGECFDCSFKSYYPCVFFKDFKEYYMNNNENELIDFLGTKHSIPITNSVEFDEINRLLKFYNFVCTNYDKYVNFNSKYLFCNIRTDTKKYYFTKEISEFACVSLPCLIRNLYSD